MGPAGTTRSQPGGPAAWWQWDMVARDAGVLDPSVGQRGGILAGGGDVWTCPCALKVCSCTTSPPHPMSPSPPVP